MLGRVLGDLGMPRDSCMGSCVQSAQHACLCNLLCCAVLYCVQIVDMELPAGQSVLGARLVQVQGGGSGAAETVLLLLTQSQLVCYQLKSPA